VHDVDNYDIISLSGGNMKLESFVGETIKQIINGVVESQKSSQETDAIICPNGIHKSKNNEIITAGLGDIVQMIDFDIAVTTTEGKGTSGGVGVFVGPVTLGSKGKSESSNVSVNRIKFSVPIIFPTQSKK
jgi:hypothetical protein